MVIPYPNPKNPYGIPELVRPCDNPRHGLGCQCLRNKKKSEELKQSKEKQKEKEKEGRGRKGGEEPGLGVGGRGGLR